MNWEMEMNVLISFKAEVTLGVLWWNEGGSSKRHPVNVLQCEWSFSEVHFIVGVRLWRQVVAEFYFFSTRRSYVMFKVISPTFTRFSVQHQRTYMNLYSWKS